MLKHNPINIAVLPGDGIGKEVMLAVLPIIDELNLPIHYQMGDIGWEYWKNNANPIPKKTWELINQTQATLLGATTSKPDKEAFAELQHPNKDAVYISPIIQLRQNLDLFANVRPCFSVDKSKRFNFCVIRENTEGLYSGLDFDKLPEELKPLVAKYPQWKNKLNDEICCTLRMQSKAGLQRIIDFAFNYAVNNHYTRVSFADKPNVLRKSSAFARRIFEEIAAKFPSIQADIINIDTTGMHLVTKPHLFGVIVTENMFGDILSDVGAGVMGGLGLAPSANIGIQKCYFEPVHGSGPHMPANTANPSAMFFTLSMLLSHFGYQFHAQMIKNAVIEVIQQKKILTKDLGGKATTQTMAEAIIAHAKRQNERK